MKILITDDEPLARERLRHLLQQINGDYQSLDHEACNGEEAVRFCHQYQPDIVLLDIQMPVLGGIEAAAQIRKAEQPPAIIFCTAYDDRALDAFDVQADGFLLKPIRKQELQRALRQAAQPNRLQMATILHQPAHENDKNHIAVTTLRGVELIPVNDTLYFMADSKYVTACYMKAGQISEIILDETLKTLEKLYTPQFIRVHRNALVSRKAIESLIRHHSGHYFIKLKELPTPIAVSRRHVSQVKGIMGNL